MTAIDDNNAKILIVDDQPENLVALEALLSGFDQQIIRAGSGREALKLLLDNEVALILLDIQMPDMDGFETAAMIRQREVSKHIPIIFLTAMYTEDVYESEAYALGAVDFITKPFASHVLLSKVHFFVDLFRKTQRIKQQNNLIREIEKRRMEEVRDRLEAEKQRMVAELARKEKERELLEERSTQLQKADKLKDEFLANMSHEIRTPMNAVIGFSELLLGTSLDSEQYEFGVRIKESAQGLLTLINDILDLSKIAAGKLDLEPVDFELAPLVEGTAAILSESARDKKLSLMTYIDPELPRTIFGDPGRLRQVLLNLVGNAIKFTEAGEVIVKVTRVETLEPAPDGKMTILFSISDTGIGLSLEEQGRLFRPFTQADGSTTRKFGGTGLGLSISKRLVELMDGEISVASLPGQGSTFSFVVNLKPGDLEKPAAPDEFKQVRVLLVDSQQSARDILHSYLTSWKIRVDTADGAGQALKMMAEQERVNLPYDLVFMESKLPDLSAFELLENIRNDGFIDTRMILCTGDDGLGERALKSGFSAYLTKPVMQSTLFDCILRVIKGDKLPSVVGSISDTNVPVYRKSSERFTILLAEDNPVNQMVTQLQLKKLGHNCKVVSNGKEAIQALEETPYVLVLMDCQMPDMDGLEAAKAIRKAEVLTGRHVPIVGLTAHAMSGDREKCIAAGMDDYLSKPASIEQLNQTLAKWLPKPETCLVQQAD